MRRRTHGGVGELGEYNHGLRAAEQLVHVQHGQRDGGCFTVVLLTCPTHVLDTKASHPRS